MLMDDCVVGVVVENCIKISALSKPIDGQAEVSSLEAESIITAEHICMYAVEG